MFVCQTNEFHLHEITHLQNLLRSQVEGLLISLSRDTNTYEHIERLTRKGFLLVLFDRYAEGIQASKVTVDNHAAAFQATEHLLANGCRRIGFLAGPPNLLISNQRLAGYRAALVKHGLSTSAEYIGHCDYTQENAISQTLNLMGRLPLPDGLLVVSDRIAFPAMYALKQQCVRIPEEVAVVSFNNEPLAALQVPSLTSVSQPIQEMGRETVRVFLKQVHAQGDPIAPETRVLETHLIVRESSLHRMPG